MTSIRFVKGIIYGKEIKCNHLIKKKIVNFSLPFLNLNQIFKSF